jgi:hypothetical protein
MGLAPEPARIVLLGASNVRRSLPAIVRLARGEFGSGLEILGAFGHGRSYGKRSCIPFRCLPGILECGLWKALERDLRQECRALITDVGNDLLYGEDAGTILEWIAECVERLAGARITITGLPLARIEALGRGQYLLFRSLFFPFSRQPRGRVISAAREVDAGLRALARAAGVRFVELDPAWYGADPVHIRRAVFATAWGRILGTKEAPAPTARRESIRLRLAPPERRWVWGIERRHPQPVFAGRDGTRISLY